MERVQAVSRRGTGSTAGRIVLALGACLCVALLLAACGGKGGGKGGKGGLLSGTDPQNKDCETAISTNPITVKELEPLAEANGLDPAALLAKIKEICTDPTISSPVDKAIAALKPQVVGALPPTETPPTEAPPTEAPPTEAPPTETSTTTTESGGTESGSGEGYCVESGPGAFAPGCQGEIVPNPPSGTG